MAGGYDCGIWGWADGLQSFIPLLAAASNVIVGSNPPYSATDFLTFYPKFGGTPKSIAGSLVSGSVNLTAVTPNLTGIATGQYVTGPGVAPGTTVVSASGTTIVLSLPAIANTLPGQFNVFTSPLLPTAVLNAYIYLASNSIFQQRWGEMWLMAMSLYIAHFCELWLIGEASTPNSTAAQAASSGLAFGIKTSKSAGDVSVGSQAIVFEGYGAWNLTIYGLELITFANVVGSGNMLFL